MANFVQNKNQFEAFRTMHSDRFSDIKFENNPFNERYKSFVSFEFDYIYRESFFDGLKIFLGKIENKTVVFYTINPSPNAYFYNHFQKYSIFEISSTAMYEELNEIMMRDPGESPADALAIKSDEISCFSKSAEWALIASRDWEIAVVGFASLTIKNQFLDSFSEDARTMFTSVQVQVEVLTEMLCFNEDVQIAYQNLLENYKDKVSI